MDQNVTCAAAAAAVVDSDSRCYNDKGAAQYQMEKSEKMPSLFDDNDDDAASVDFDNCMESDVTGAIDTSIPNNVPARKKTRGRVKINIELIQDKERRSTTFSKRKNGILKKVIGPLFSKIQFLKVNVALFRGFALCLFQSAIALT